MITLYPFETLGHRDFGWLDTRYHFSFGDYHNAARTHFGTLRVVNDDIVRAGAGFDMHPHRDMEIITYVRKGAITHVDSLGNEGRTAAGDVQVMSAGTGITHAEFNRENEDAHLYQIWIFPREKGAAPRWDAAQFPREFVDGELKLLVSGRREDEGKGALYINADATIHGGRLKKGDQITHELRSQAYVLVAAGSIAFNGQKMKKGDGAEVTNASRVSFTATEDAEILIIDVPRR
jgi:quercetin 2,3-dioxygenase